MQENYKIVTLQRVPETMIWSREPEDMKKKKSEKVVHFHRLLEYQQNDGEKFAILNEKSARIFSNLKRLKR